MEPATIAKIADFNRRLHPVLLEVCAESGISPECVVLAALFAMEDGTWLPAGLGPPVTVAG